MAEPTSETPPPVDRYHAAEARFERLRNTAGFVLGPAAFVAVLLTPLGVSPEAHRLAAIAALVVVLWVCEAVPMAITALLVPVLAVVLQVAPARQAFAPFADPIIFLFIGTFMLARAMAVQGLDKRIATVALTSRAAAGGHVRLLLVYGAVTTFLSMWMSNVAATALMFPIGLALVTQLPLTGPHAGLRARYAIALMLLTSFGASIGGFGTPVGTPPNLIGVGLLERTVGYRIAFFQWMAFGVPLLVVLFTVMALVFKRSLGTVPPGVMPDLTVLRRDRAALGRLTPGERNVLVAFGLTVGFWVMPGVFVLAGIADTWLARQFATAVPEAIAALIGALLLFVLPTNWRRRQFTLTWDQAAHIEWGIVLLYGGGLALGDMAFTTGLATALGEGLTSLIPAPTTFGISALFAAVAVLLSETTSNTASANVVVPVAISVAQAAGVDPVVPALAATLGASLGFMMPISTPPNAIVYGSGLVPLAAMMRYGFILDIVGYLAILLALFLIVPFVV